MNFQKSLICFIISLLVTAVVYELNEIVRYFALQAGGEMFNGAGSYVNSVALICCLASIFISGGFVIRNIIKAMKIHSGESEAKKAEAKAEKKAEIQQVIAENKKFTEIVEEDKAEAESEAAAPAKIEKTKPIKQKSKVNKKK